MVTSALAAPRRLPDDALQGLFVQREPLVSRLAERLVEGARRGERHHLLLIGPEGSGTSHLAEFVTRRVEAASLAGLRVVRLPELGDRVASWPHLLRTLVEAAEGRGPGADAEADDAGAEPAEGAQDLASLDADGRAAALVQRWRAAVGEQSLLVVIEGLEALFGSLGADGQHGLRGFLQTEAGCALLATTARVFPAVAERDAPCFGLFATTYLDALEDDALVELVGRRRAWLARGAPDARGDAERRSLDDALPGLVPLLGRWPGPWALLAQALAAGAEPAAAVVEVAAASRIRARAGLARLSPQQRMIVLRLADRGGGAPVKALARDGWLSEQTAARQLGELRAAGWVAAERVGRETWYELAEPLVRWSLLLDGPADAARLRATARMLLPGDAPQTDELVSQLREAADVADVRAGLAERARADGVEALTRAALASLPQVAARSTSDPAAETWRAAWSALADQRPEFRPAARWVAVAFAARAGDDPRPRLGLPAEQRALVDAALAAGGR